MTGQEALSLQGHSRGVTVVSYSPDGQWIVSGSGDHTVRLWDAERGALLAVFPCLDDVRATFICPTERLIHVADAGAGTGAPRVYLLELVGC
jgi:WD40 repeat protein